MDGDEWMHSNTDRGVHFRGFLGITAYHLLPTHPIEPGGGGKGNGELQTIRDIAFRISLIAGGSD